MSLKSMGRRLFGSRKKEVDVLAEEAMQGQFITIIKRLFSKPVNVIAFAVFMIFLVSVVIGPIFLPLDENYQDMTQQNVSPGRSMLDVPDALKGDVKQVSVGSTYSVGLSTSGGLYIWGETQISKNVDLIKDAPSGMGKIRMVAAGFDHIVAINEDL